jgi:hypothetical protein
MRSQVLIQMYQSSLVHQTHHPLRLHVPLHLSTPGQYTSSHREDNVSSAKNFTWQKHVMPHHVKDLSEEYGTNITGTCESRVDGIIDRSVYSVHHVNKAT